ncbi:hypothetical protein V2A60_001334 [Cordyceps javanica]
MRHTILLVTASIGYALPQASPAGQLLKFQPPQPGSGISCPSKIGGYNETECGTKRYCKAIDVFGAVSDKFSIRPIWNSTKECLDAHKPEPKQELLQFRMRTSSAGVDCEFQRSESSCGTEWYCEDIDALEKYHQKHGEDNEQTEDVRYESTQECFKAHHPEPKNLPWLERDEQNWCGSRGDVSEETCGTQAFCDLFTNTTDVFGSPYIWNREQCLQAHEPNPGSVNSPDN